jgi:hypothetical protein
VKKAFTGILAAMAITSVAYSQKPLTQVPVHDKPVWQVVTGSPDAPGLPVPVRSLSTNQVMGALPVDSRFLSFGSNGQIVTLAVNGELVYVPTSAVSKLYPVAPKPEIPPPGRDSLEDLAEAYDKRMSGQAGVSLKLKDSLEAKVPQPIVGAGANPAMPGSDYMGGGAMPYGQPQPGAALMGGGIPALGAMANPYGGQPQYK